MRITAEFLVEPFREGDPGPHVRAAVDELVASDLTVDVGPFGTSVDGESADVLAALARALAAALVAGATRVTLHVEPSG